MNTNNAMRTVVRESGLSMRRVSELMGRSSSWLGATLQRPGSSEAATVARLASVCGYKLALVPRDSVPDSAIVIDPGE